MILLMMKEKHLTNLWLKKTAKNTSANIKAVESFSDISPKLFGIPPHTPNLDLLYAIMTTVSRLSREMMPWKTTFVVLTPKKPHLYVLSLIVA